MRKYSLCADEDFMRVYRGYRNTVYGVAFNYTKNKADADDILQDVFLKYYNSDKTFQGDEHIKAWLIRVTVNTCKKHLMSFWTKLTVPIDDTIPFEDKSDLELFDAVMSLPKSYRMVIHLHYYEGYKISEIASILDAKESTIKVRLMRARKILKEKEAWPDELSREV